MYNRITGMDGYLAWIWGWQAKTIEIQVIKVDAYTDGIAGDTFTDVDLQDFTLLRQYESRTTTNTIIYWAVVQAVTPGETIALQTGTLSTGGAETDLVFTSSATMYEHLYEMSSDGRLTRLLTTAEVATLTPQAVATDKRTCMASLAKKFNGYYFLFNNTKAQGFELKYSAQKIVELTAPWVGYGQDRIKVADPTYGEVDFTVPCPLKSPANLITTNQTRIEIGELTSQYDGSNFIYYGVTEAMVGADIPVEKQADTESGLYFTDPTLSGAQKMKFTATITHADGTTFQDYRDNRTPLAARISSISGAFSQEILVKSFTLNKAGPDGGDVASEPLDTSVRAVCGTHVFDTWLSNGVTTDNPETQGSPMVMRVVNDNPYNEMTGRDLAGALRS